ncbi:HAD family hydrolase [Sporosarcina sp. P2]|uniref:HAD family hydrolase n=1 Tax=Sporosarcina sp. P2 TaxID=2048251 RepID=UPI00351029BA
MFDMDDTLYDEYTYVRSGFLEVASFLSDQLSEEQEVLFTWMWNRLHTTGRGTIFDDVLKEFNNYSALLVKNCVTIYRQHIPNIFLPQETINCLEQLKNFTLYLVTDGDKVVQHNKAQVLDLYDRMEHCYITHCYGIENAKPSPYCFLDLLKKESVESDDVVYIGDNPIKDFVGIKPFGFQTIRIMTGQHKDIEMPIEYEADHRISLLNELPSKLEEIWPEVKGMFL